MNFDKIKESVEAINREIKYIESIYNKNAPLNDLCKYFLMLNSTSIHSGFIENFVPDLFQKIIEELHKDFKIIHYKKSMITMTNIKTERKHCYSKKIQIDFERMTYDITLKIYIANSVTIDFYIQPFDRFSDANNFIENFFLLKQLEESKWQKKENTNSFKRKVFSGFSLDAKNQPSETNKKNKYLKVIESSWDKLVLYAQNYYNLLIELNNFIDSRNINQKNSIYATIKGSDNISYSSIVYFLYNKNYEDFYIPQFNGIETLSDESFVENRQFGNTEKSPLYVPIRYSKEGIDLFCKHYDCDLFENDNDVIRIKSKNTANTVIYNTLYDNRIDSFVIPTSIVLLYTIIYGYQLSLSKKYSLNLKTFSITKEERANEGKESKLKYW